MWSDLRHYYSGPHRNLTFHMPRPELTSEQLEQAAERRIPPTYRPAALSSNQQNQDELAAQILARRRAAWGEQHGGDPNYWGDPVEIAGLGRDLYEAGCVDLSSQSLSVVVLRYQQSIRDQSVLPSRQQIYDSHSHSAYLLVTGDLQSFCTRCGSMGMHLDTVLCPRVASDPHFVVHTELGLACSQCGAAGDALKQPCQRRHIFKEKIAAEHQRLGNILAAYSNSQGV